MLQYTLRRLFLGLLTALLVSVIVFVILRIAPGDVVDVILGGEDAFYSQETEELLREQLGLNKPLYEQYFHLHVRLRTARLGRVPGGQQAQYGHRSRRSCQSHFSSPL